MFNYNYIFQVTIQIIEVLILLLVLVRLLRWHSFYYMARKKGCTPYNFRGKVKRVLYVKPVDWLRQRNHFFRIDKPIEVKDYSEGQSYYVKSKQK